MDTKSNTSLDKLYFISKAILAVNVFQESDYSYPGNKPPSKVTNLKATSKVLTRFKALNTNLKTILNTFFFTNILLLDNRRHTLITENENMHAITNSIITNK